MSTESAPLRFDRREVALAFALFVFVSLSMFTVGIVVGKGLSQARYESLLVKMAQTAAIRPEDFQTSRKTDAVKQPSAPAIAEAAPEAAKPSARESTAVEQETGDAASTPQKDAVPRWYEFRSSQTQQHKGRGLASMSPIPAPESFAAGRYAVQVGSYGTKEDAEARVEQLKKFGFPYAHFSVKELGEPKEVWYRVWLGYFVDYDSAKKSGELLQERGEVKNYLVRKMDPAGT